MSSPVRGGKQAVALGEGVEPLRPPGPEERSQRHLGGAPWRRPRAADVDLDGQFGRHEPGEILALEQLMAVVGRAVNNVSTIYQALGISDEEVLVRFSVINAQGRRLRAPATWTIYDGNLISQIPRHAQRTGPIEEWTANAEELAPELVSDLMQRFNAVSPLLPPRVLQKVLPKGR